MEVFLEIEGDIDGRDGKEESSLILLHYLHQSPVPLHKPQDHLQGKDPAPPEVSLGTLALEPESHPFLARPLRRQLEVLPV